MESVTSIATTPYRKRVKARKDSDGQEAVIETAVIKERIEELVRLHQAVVDARTDLTEAVKSAAEDSGLNAGAVKAFVRARAAEDFSKHKQRAEQLSLLFDEVGLVTTS
jgi:hypothetical protein